MRLRIGAALLSFAITVGYTTYRAKAAPVEVAQIEVAQIFEQSPAEKIDEVWQLIYADYIDPSNNNNDWEAIRQEYLNRSYSSSEETYAAIKEMISLLGDPLTQFFTPDEFTAMQVSSAREGETGGIGLQLSLLKNEGGYLVIQLTKDETPAAIAGILRGDILLSIDGNSAEGMPRTQTITALRGPIDTPVTLVIARDQQEIELTLNRVADPYPQSIQYHIQQISDKNVGYIRMTAMNASTKDELHDAIIAMEPQVDGYLLDLTNNTGGLLFGIVDIAELWLPAGMRVVSTSDRMGTVEAEFTSRAAVTQKPMVVLTNSSTISGGEILVAALQENQRAVVVGAQTEGANSIQSVRGLTDGSGIAVTVAKWLTPNGTDIGGVGLSPDISVSVSAEQENAFAREPALRRSSENPAYVEAVDVLMQQLQ